MQNEDSLLPPPAPSSHLRENTYQAGVQGPHREPVVVLQLLVVAFPHFSSLETLSHSLHCPVQQPLVCPLWGMYLAVALAANQVVERKVLPLRAQTVLGTPFCRARKPLRGVCMTVSGPARGPLGALLVLILTGAGPYWSSVGRSQVFGGRMGLVVRFGRCSSHQPFFRAFLYPLRPIGWGEAAFRLVDDGVNSCWFLLFMLLTTHLRILYSSLFRMLNVLLRLFFRRPNILLRMLFLGLFRLLNTFLRLLTFALYRILNTLLRQLTFFRMLNTLWTLLTFTIFRILNTLLRLLTSTLFSMLNTL